MRSGPDAASAARRAHLALLPPARETALAWGEEGLEPLRGSWWHGEVRRRQEGIAADFRALEAELGPAASEALGLDRAGYSWARLVLEEFGLRFLSRGGAEVTVLAPGLELLAAPPTSGAPPGAAGARLEVWSEAAQPALVLYAEADLYPGDRVSLSHGGLACGNGERLLGRGWLLEPNPYDSLQLPLALRMDAASQDSPELAELAERVAQALEEDVAFGAPPRGPGEALSLGALGGRLPVRLRAVEPGALSLQEGPVSELGATLCLTAERPLPGRAALVLLGVALLADSERAPAIQEEERELRGVWNAPQCERRALLFLQGQLRAALDAYPAAASQEGSEDSSTASMGRLTRAGFDVLAPAGGLPPRAARCRQVLGAERRILAASLLAVQVRLAELLTVILAPGAPAQDQERAGFLRALAAALPVGDQGLQGYGLSILRIRHLVPRMLFDLFLVVYTQCIEIAYFLTISHNFNLARILTISHNFK